MDGHANEMVHGLEGCTRIFGLSTERTVCVSLCHPDFVGQKQNECLTVFDKQKGFPLALEIPFKANPMRLQAPRQAKAALTLGLTS